MEIERKFLPSALPPEVLSSPSKRLSQCYISTSPTIRIRQSDEDYILTVKGKGLLAREEWELPLTKEEYLLLFLVVLLLMHEDNYIVLHNLRLYENSHIFHITFLVYFLYF